MHAYLLIGNEDGSMKETAINLAGSQFARLTPFTLQKIADVKELSKLTRLTLSKTAFYIEHIDEASNDALNAFLKQLEEPGENIIYILTASSHDKVLSTIASRCQVIKVQSSKFKIQSKENEAFFNQLIGQQFQIVDKIKKREDAIVFMQNVIEELHQELISQANSQQPTTNSLVAAQQTLTALLKNGNVTSQLTRFIVELSHC